MTFYQLASTIRSPGSSIGFLEFSPNGRFLAVGHGYSSVSLLDKTNGFGLKISNATPTYPTALAWETSKSFYVGLDDGRFIYYTIDLRGNQLVKGPVDGRFCGAFPVTAIGLNKDRKILAVSVGPEVFIFQRALTTSEFICNYITAMNLRWPS